MGKGGWHGMGMGQPSKGQVHPTKRPPTREVNPAHRAGARARAREAA
jgi:hypothetical protein